MVQPYEKNVTVRERYGKKESEVFGQVAVLNSTTRKSLTAR